MGVRIELMYRDGDNHKTFDSVLLKGAIDADQIRSIASLCDEGCRVIANEIGLPTPAEKMLAEYGESGADHVFTTLEQWEERLPEPEELHANEPEPRFGITVGQLIDQLRQAPWDIGKEMMRLHL